MLKFLSIRDFVIVSELELDFLSGFTALTGETGAGKSILIDALSLALGERGDAGMVRNGCERAEIAAEFDIASSQSARQWLREQDMSGDPDVCLFRRVLEKSGRSRGFINGRSATLQQMRAVGELLLDIHGQHAHQSLLRADTQRELLDGYANSLANIGQVADKHREWQTLHRRHVELTENAATLAAERDLLSFQRTELEQLQFKLTEWKTAQEDHERLAHASELLDTAASGVEILSESDSACLAQISAVVTRLRAGVTHDPGLSEALQLLESVQAELQEAVYALRHYQQHLDVDPERLQALELRIQTVMGAARKYRVAPEELDDVLQKVEVRLAELGSDTDLEELLQQEKRAQQDYLAVAKELSQTRKKAADILGGEITDAMQKLAMQGGSFAVALIPLAEGNAHGLETIEFQVAANPGTPLRSLAKVASGGELSRISLAIQVATSRVASVPTLIFDEVDNGIGGGVAEIVGKLLKRLGTDYQVLCVTHLPQVAAAADQQWQVSKDVTAGVTLSHISVLNDQQRVEEIARMLGGVQITETTRKHAGEMLRGSA
jgi:DNA repair protein RecN (Recombination protein N)